MTKMERPIAATFQLYPDPGVLSIKRRQAKTSGRGSLCAVMMVFAIPRNPPCLRRPHSCAGKNGGRNGQRRSPFGIPRPSDCFCEREAPAGKGSGGLGPTGSALAAIGSHHASGSAPGRRQEVAAKLPRIDPIHCVILGSSIIPPGCSSAGCRRRSSGRCRCPCRRPCLRRPCCCRGRSGR